MRTYYSEKIYVDVGGGLSLGRLIYTKGAMHSYNYSYASGYTKNNSTEDLRSNLATPYLSLNAEVNMGIKLSSRQYFIMGTRLYLESSDGLGFGGDVSLNLFVAYSIR